MYSLYAVDDDALILDEVMHGIPWLESGFEVIGGSTSPFEAQEAILRLRPAAVICDLKMPGMDGVALFDKVRAAGVGSEFVLLSAFGTFEDSRSFFLKGGFNYVLKPPDVEEISMVFGRLAKQLAGGQAAPAPTGYQPTGVENFDALVAYVAQHYSERFTLEKLGQRFFLSPNYICNLFAKHYQSTFTTFLTDLRMQKAAEEIAGTTAALKEVAISCGYGNYFYFCKQFKAYYGASPSVWREQNRPAAPGEK